MMYPPRPGLPAVALAVIVAAAGCEAEREGSAELGSATCTIRTEPVATLGAEADAASVRDIWAVDVARLPDGGWAVVQFGRSALVYDAEGGFVGELGRRGQGPGEWTMPARVAVDPHDSIWLSEHRGRAVVLPAEGGSARTMVDPDFAPVDGFTGDGDPYSLRYRPDPSDPSSVELLAQVWSRETGETRFTVGPGAVESHEVEGTSGIGVGPSSMALGNTIYVARGPDLWLARWTAPGVEDTLATGTEILAGLERAGVPVPFHEGEPTGVLQVAEEGIWLAGVVRAVTPEAEAGLQERHAEALGISASAMEVRWSPDVRNEAFDGVLLRLSRDGSVAEAVTLEGYPWGAVRGASQYYTFHSTERGLIQARIWEFERVCRE